MPKFLPGQSGNPAGLKKGTKHKIHYDVARIISEIKYVDRMTGKTATGFNPFEALAILGATSQEEKIVLDASRALAEYLAPKLKHIEHAADSENPITITLNMGTKK